MMFVQSFDEYYTYFVGMASMPVLGNEELGLVEEALRRREVYARYFEKRVSAVVDDPATERLIEAEVAQRCAARSGAGLPSERSSACARCGSGFQPRARASSIS